MPWIAIFPVFQKRPLRRLHEGFNRTYGRENRIYQRERIAGAIAHEPSYARELAKARANSFRPTAGRAAHFVSLAKRGNIVAQIATQCVSVGKPNV